MELLIGIANLMFVLMFAIESVVGAVRSPGSMNVAWAMFITPIACGICWVAFTTGFSGTLSPLWAGVLLVAGTLGAIAFFRSRRQPAPEGSSPLGWRWSFMTAITMALTGGLSLLRMMLA